MTDEAAAKDWVQGRRMMIWGWPALGLIVSGVLDLEMYAWPPLLAWMGVACLLNARRCGRRHCFYTGPFFLALAGLSLVHGIGLVDFGPAGWRWLGLSLVIGWLILHYGVEALWGKYR